MDAKLYGIGVGPGDPELLTLKAINIIHRCDVLCYVSNEVGKSTALDIVKPHLEKLPQMMSVVLPMKMDRAQANQDYTETAEKIEAMVNAGQSVAMICEGDPFYYGSFIYIYHRLADRCAIDIVPGISSIHAAAATLKLPLCTQKDKQAVVTARSSDVELIKILQEFETVVILKAGKERQRIKVLIQEYASAFNAAYVENVGRADEFMLADLSLLPEGPGGYFSLFICVKQATA